MADYLKCLLKCLPPPALKMLGDLGFKEIAEELEFVESIKILLEGDTFTRTTKFMLMSKTEEVFIQMLQFSESVFSLKWRTQDGKKEGDIKMGDIKEIKNGIEDTQWKIVGNSGDTLLDVSAKDDTIRDQWVETLQRVLQRVRLSPEAMEQESQPKTMIDQVKEKAAKQVHCFLYKTRS